MIIRIPDLDLIESHSHPVEAAAVDDVVAIGDDQDVGMALRVGEYVDDGGAGDGADHRDNDVGAGVGRALDDGVGAVAGGEGEGSVGAEGRVG